MPNTKFQLSPDDRQLEASLHQLVVESDARLRQQLVNRATQQLPSMRAGGASSYRRAGWYSARELAEMAAMGFPIPALELEFPVPASSPSWHLAELDAKRDLVFRFFVRSAWLSVTPPPAGAMGLRIRVLFGIEPFAIAETVVRVEGAAVACKSELENDGGRVVDIMFAAAALSSLTIRLDCAYAGIPARIYPGSTDGRLVSAAIAKPEWLLQG